MIFVLLILGLIAGWIAQGKKEKRRRKPKCPYCQNYETRDLGFLSRIERGGFVGTAGKSYICSGCGMLF
jgi:hypothetical protein